ncbi:TIGR03086 family metal-binding protein [Labedaea rhizosphaerae]|uniref:Uncharacterized protein (TIGR03086 family) n=1 Tax=Labedaea rhizosphaerae TaxID=598644 RepID=A0A4R6S8K5_LABRH|nr:TIGR03086 family metal-binding protein [Labedaea rhizosphaerae]TDP96180.1 uncharacterized protein (TIGR03086 family) [Labedaea rhizosphaerae]
MRSNELMAAAAPQAKRVVAGVRDDQLDAPTPCSQWTVRRLLNHLLLWSGTINALAAKREPIPVDLKDGETDYVAEPGWAKQFAQSLDDAVAAWSEPGALEGTTSMGRSDMPAEVVVKMLFGELVFHVWDLARATGQPFDCDEELAEAARQVVEMFEQGREHGVYQAVVPVPDDASTLDKALALSGRDPDWSA